ncbi:hypothetical protein OC846_001939 [Tilletia horrida]|uniref:CAP-Gly domain-containing protein n=1 Tax=Tilletia horrida TaxID=155126 RepID=A0AAN6JT33_9BASI|nr:hypothetical protein OC846_001939 [Tilletia horrida]
MASVTLFVHAGPRLSEQRFSSSLTLNALAGRLELITGIPSGSQKLSLYSARTDQPGEDAKLVADLSQLSADDFDATLASAGAQDGMGLKVDDTRPPSIANQFLDDSQVEKYEMDEETYAKRTDSVRAWKQRNRFGEFADVSSESSQQAVPSEEQLLAQLPSELKVGARCVVDASGTATNERRGTIRYVGFTEFAKGSVWVGVEYDEPVGKNDGCVQGKQYFAARANYGGFVKPDKVKVGDYPPIDLMADDDDDLDEM